MNGMLTIAKNSNDLSFIKEAYSLGFTDYRLNMDYEKESMRALDNLRSLEKSDVKIFADFQGVKMRIQLPEQESERSYSVGDYETFYFFEEAFPYISNIESIVDYLSVGQIVSIADEKITGIITEKHENRIVVQFNFVSYVIRQNAGCSFSGEGIPPVKMTKQACSKIAKHEVIQKKLIDWVILSFASDASEISEFVIAMHELGIKVMAKIETLEGVENISALSKIVDGFMIGRGDLKNTAKEKFKHYYEKALKDVSLNKKEYSGVGTFFFSNYSETNILTDEEQKDFLNVKSLNFDYVMLSKEVVNSKYPYETIRLLSKFVKRRSKMLIVIEGDNGTGKTTLGNLLKEKGYRVISEEPKLIAMAKEFKNFPAGNIERFNAFVGYNEYCLKESTKQEKSVIIRSWISTVSAAYADGLMDMKQAKTTAENFLSKYPIPDIIIRLECDFSIRISRIKTRSMKDNDKSDDLTKLRNEKYQAILEVMKSYFTNWIDIDTSTNSPEIILNRVLSLISEQD